MRSTESSTFPGPGQTVAKAAILPVLLDHGGREAAHVLRLEEAQREALLGGSAPREPVVRDRPERAELRGHVLAGEDAERPALPLQPSQGVAEGLALGALEREAAQGDPRFLAELDEREAEVGEVVERLLPHLVEDGTPGVVVAALQEAPDEVGANHLRAHRVAERDPRAPPHAVHEEAGARLVEEQRLVAHEREEGEGRRLRGDRALGLRELLVGRGLHLRRRRAQQPGGAKDEERHHGADRGTQEARRVLLQLEPPPQVVRVLHVLEGEEAEPHGRPDDRQDGQRPAGGEAPVEERDPSIERGSARGEREEDEAQQRRLLVVARPSAARPRSRGRARAPRGSRPRRAVATRRARRRAARPPRGCRGSARPRGAAAAGSPTATRRGPARTGSPPRRGAPPRPGK